MENAELISVESVQWNQQFLENSPGPHMAMDKTIACLIK